MASMQKKIESLAKNKKSEASEDELNGIDIPKGSILEDVADWADYEAGEVDSSIKDILEELLDKGVRSGMTFLISNEDGQNFFNEHKDEINKILGDYISENKSPFTTDGWDDEDPLALGANNQFCLAAFAFEEVARALLDKIS